MILMPIKNIAGVLTIVCSIQTADVFTHFSKANLQEHSAILPPFKACLTVFSIRAQQSLHFHKLLTA